MELRGPLQSVQVLTEVLKPALMHLRDILSGYCDSAAEVIVRVGAHRQRRSVEEERSG
jgi:hypothetical protein